MMGYETQTGPNKRLLTTRRGRVRTFGVGSRTSYPLHLKPTKRSCSRQTPAARYPGIAGAIGLLALLVWGSAGCGPASLPRSETAENANRSSLAKPSPEEAFDAMILAYQQATAYSDRGEIQLSYRSGGRLQRDVAPLSVAFQRPGRLQLQAYQVELVSDGEYLQGKIQEPETNNLDGQVIRRETPSRISLSWLYEDNLLREVLQHGLGRQPIQLELLLSEHPMADFRDPNVSRRYLDDRTHQGHRCYRLEVLTREGPFVFWIDQQQWLLRRLEYPTHSLRRAMDPRLGVSDMSLVAEFHDTQFATVSDRFALDRLPEGARPLRRFVRPTQPLPSNLFGRKAAPFTLYELDESPITSESLQGRITILHWYVDHPACQASLELLERVRQRWGDDVQVAIHVVNAEASTTPRESLERRMEDWGFQLPILRDRDAAGRDVFEIDVLPALVVLGEDGTIQLLETTYNPRLDEHLEEAVERLRAGEDLGRAVIAQAHQDAVQYQRLLTAASSQDSPAMYSISQIEPTLPETLRLRRLWSCSELSRPGNLVTVPRASGELRLLVLQGGTEIAELDSRGKVIRRHKLPVSGDERLSLVRAARGSSGSLHFTVAEWGGQHIFLLNEQFELVWTAPPPGLRHDGILDVQFADVTGDGQLDVCALLSGAGLVAWDLAGKEVARFANLAGISSARAIKFAPTASDRISSVRLTEPSTPRHSAWGLLVTTENGRIAQVSASSSPRAADPHPLSPIFDLFLGDRLDGLSCYVGVTYDPNGERMALGLTRDFEETWSYRLPGGAHATPLQWASYLPWLNEGSGGWCFVSPDGAVHFVGDDGVFHDYFFPGGGITGMGQAGSEQEPLLFLAGDGLVECWTIEQP